jgi:hypothetical protein
MPLQSSRSLKCRCRPAAQVGDPSSKTAVAGSNPAAHRGVAQWQSTV